MPRQWMFLAAYTCSGFAGLVYEVAWTRLLTLPLGHTIAAASTVTAAFMGGLGLGAALGGRVASRLTPRGALQAYALLETLVVSSALLIAIGIGSLTSLLGWAYQDGASGTLFPIARLISCLVVLLLPATALGATFPMAVRWTVNAPNHTGQAAGRVYAANTVGAAVGALVAGFLLIPAVGLLGTTLVGIAFSSISIAVVLALARVRDAPRADHVLAAAAVPAGPIRPTRGAARKPAASGRSRREAGSPADPGQFGLAATVLALTGLATFIYEIAWTRVVSMSLGPSTYAFAATLTSFITGLAIGSSIGAVIAGRTRRPALVTAAALAGTALVATYSAFLAGGPLLRDGIAQLATPTADLASLFVHQVATVMRLTLPVACGLGLAFPLALDVAGARDAAPARQLGSLYAINTLAAVAGSLVTGFVAIPLIGLQHTLTMATVAVLLGAGAVLWWGRLLVHERLVALVPVAAAIAWMVLSPPWDRELLASGAYLYRRFVPPGMDVEAALEAGTLLYYREGATGTVSVKESTGVRSLAIDGKVDASTSRDMLTQKTLAHLPLLLHESPRTVGIVGLGSGVTLASALVHPVASVDVVEISPEVVEASRYFLAENRNALADPRTRLIVGDGRSHLALTSRRYDVVISEPSNPWMAGVAALFTREFFLTVRERLSADGVFCQWAHTYDIGDADLRSIVATFGSVFPRGTMWLVGDGDLLLVGSKASASLDRRLEQVARAWQRPGVAEDLRAVSMMDPFALLSLLVGGPEEMTRYAGQAQVQTDDRMALEFSGPFGALGGVTRDHSGALRALWSDGGRPPVVERTIAEATGTQWRDRGAMLLAAQAVQTAYRDYATAFGLTPTDAGTLDGLVRAAVASRHEADAERLLRASTAARPSEGAPRVALAKLLGMSGRFDEATDVAVGATAVVPREAAAWEQLAALHTDRGDVERLGPVVAVLRRDFPERAGTWYFAATASFLRGNTSDAQQLARRAVEIDPGHADAYNLLGALYATAGDIQAAREAFRTSLRLDPRDSVTYANLAQLELSENQRQTAARFFAQALSLDPGSAQARQGLAEARGPR